MKLKLFVIFFHLLAILWLTLSHQTAKPLRTPLTVKTYHLSPAEVKKSSPAVAATSVPSPPALTAAQDPPKVVKKAETKPQVAAPKATAKQVPVEKQSPNQELIQLMQKSINTLDTASVAAQVKSPVAKSSTLGALASEKLNLDESYEELLVAALQTQLTLPEKGEVKLRLILTRDGQIQKIESVQSASAQNRTYIESALPSCYLPSFGSHFKGQKVHTFTFTLISRCL